MRRVKSICVLGDSVTVTVLCINLLLVLRVTVRRVTQRMHGHGHVPQQVAKEGIAWHICLILLLVGDP